MVVSTPYPVQTPNTESLPLAPVLEPSTSSDESYTRRTRFVPLDRPVFLAADAASHLSDDELVLGLEWRGAARAYPIQMMRYHHIANDVVDGGPFLVTY